MALVIRESDVKRLLTMQDCLEVLEEVFQQQAKGSATNQPRRRVHLPNGTLNVLAAAAPDMGVVGVKAYAGIRGVVRHVVLLFSSESGEVLAILEADRLGQLRTGAATGLATKHLARQDASTVGIYGTGRMARAQLEAVCAVRPIRYVRAYARDPRRRVSFCQEMSEKLAVEVVPADRPEDAAEGADIVVTMTIAKEPVLKGAWLEPGAHVNAVGANALTRREIDEEVVQRSALVVVDSKEQAAIESGDLLWPLQRGLINWERVFELRDVVAGRIARTDPQQITLFESLGLALEDISTALRVYQKARATGSGEVVELFAELDR